LALLAGVVFLVGGGVRQSLRPAKQSSTSGDSCPAEFGSLVKRQFLPIIEVSKVVQAA